MIELVPTSPDYAELWKTWREEPSALQHNPLLTLDVEALRERMRKMSSDFSQLGTASEFQFFIKHDGELVGALGMFGFNPRMSYAEIGYGIGERFRGRGLATAAVAALVQKIFAETPVRRLMAHVAEGNAASRRVVSRVGFRQEGILREHFVIDGVPTNEIVFGLLKTDPRLTSP